MLENTPGGRAAVLLVPPCIREVNCHTEKTERSPLQQEVQRMVEMFSVYFLQCIINVFLYDSTLAVLEICSMLL